jgi:hypothetical protein
MSEHEQRAICKAAGLNIDPETAEVLWEHGSGLDPYGLYDLTHEKDDYVQRNYFEEAIAAIEAMLAARAGETAKVIEGEAEVVPSLPAPGSGGIKMPKA